MLATSTGQSIRVPVDGISFRSRAAGGVKVFNTGAGEEVVSVAWIAEPGRGRRRRGRRSPDLPRLPFRRACRDSPTATVRPGKFRRLHRNDAGIGNLRSTMPEGSCSPAGR